MHTGGAYKKLVKAIESAAEIMDTLETIVQVGECLYRDAKNVVSVSKSLHASGEYIKFCRDHRGKKGSHEWYVHIGRLGGYMRWHYEREERTFESAVKLVAGAVCAGAGASVGGPVGAVAAGAVADVVVEKVFRRVWPRIKDAKSRLMTASRAKAAHSCDRSAHEAARGLFDAWDEMHRHLAHARRRMHRH